MPHITNAKSPGNPRCLLAGVIAAATLSWPAIAENATVPNFARQATHVGVKIIVVPLPQMMGGGTVGAAMDEAVDGRPHFLEQLIEILFAVFAADDGLNVETVAFGVSTDFTQQQVAMVKVLGGGLEQQESPVGTDHTFHEER